jgi:hypothetical protein
MTVDEKHYGYFQQDNAAAHTVQNSTSALHYKTRSTTGSLIKNCDLQNGRILWFVGANLKGVLAHTSHYWTSPKWDKEYASISADEVQCASLRFFRRCEECYGRR